MELNWAPIPVYKDFFAFDADEIIKNRSVFNPDYTNFVAYGGRGGSKTYSFVDAIVIEATLRPVRILCTRELQNSIEESLKAEIENAIKTRGVGHFFTILKTEIVAKNGSKFIFRGLKNNIANLKSIADVDIVICEEAENVSANSWTKLLPSIRPRDRITRGGEEIVIVLFNPDDELDDTYQRFVENPPSRCISRLVNYYDNPHFPANLERQRLDAKRLLPAKEYRHIWEGEPRGGSPDAIIELEWLKAARFASHHPEWPMVDDPKRIVCYDPAGQGRDSNAVTYKDGNVIRAIDEWLKSDDLRIASKRALNMAIANQANEFGYDQCGGFGDGVSVFVGDALEEYRREYAIEHNVIAPEIEVLPFDAGSGVVDPDEEIPGTTKTWGEQFSNAKAQIHAISAQLLYNTFRFIILGERDIAAEDLLSLDITDDEVFKKLCKEMKTPIWVKSNANSKKKVEDKKAMFKRTGQPSPNIADSVHMTSAKHEAAKTPMVW